MKARYVQRGDSIDYTPLSDVAAGDIVKLGGLIGVAKLDIKAGELGSLATVGVYEMPKTGLDTFTLGEAVAYDFENGYVTKKSTSPNATLIGFAAAPAAKTDSALNVLLVQGLT